MTMKIQKNTCNWVHGTKSVLEFITEYTLHLEWPHKSNVLSSSSVTRLASSLPQFITEVLYTKPAAVTLDDLGQYLPSLLIRIISVNDYL